MIQRRGFIGAMLAACAGPAIVRASSLMPGRALVESAAGVLAPEPGLFTFGEITTESWGDHGFREGDVISISGVDGQFQIVDVHGSARQADPTLLRKLWVRGMRQSRAYRG